MNFNIQTSRHENNYHYCSVFSNLLFISFMCAIHYIFIFPAYFVRFPSVEGSFILCVDVSAKRRRGKYFLLIPMKTCTCKPTHLSRRVDSMSQPCRQNAVAFLPVASLLYCICASSIEIVIHLNTVISYDTFYSVRCAFLFKL